jgi:CRP-like cAMP-binding protein
MSVANVSAQQDVPGIGGAQNRLLALMPPAERALIEPHLEHVPGNNGDVLAEPGVAFRYVYFPETCVISVVNPTDEGVVEVGTVGNEGMAGLSVFLDVGALPSRTIVQVPGHMQRMRASTFQEMADQQPALRQLLLRYTHAFLVQVAQTASCNRMHPIENRCARWLLMTHDRVGGADAFTLTHEFLAFMLGVRRAGVTVAAGVLQRLGLITYSRGKVTVLDRQGLEKASCECYAIVRAHFEKVLGTAG